jgi:hypothetical protein
MINAGAEGQTAEWSMLEAFAREQSVCMNTERNMILLWNHIQKVDGVEDITSAEARRSCRPEEGMRYCDLLKDDLNNLVELPETTAKIKTALTAFLAVVLNCRCFFLALCQTSVGKLRESASLLEMLHNRVEDVKLSGELQEPLGRLQPLFEKVQKSMPSRVGQWRCRGLAQLCTEAVKDKGSAKGGSAAAAKTLEDIGTLAAFPPKFRDIPCKPLLFDLAVPCIQPPDLDELVPKRRDDQKGLLGRVAGGIGSRIGGFWGRK